MLSDVQVRELTRPFRREAHEFLSGNVYIAETAITTRLDTVDPAWEFSILSLQSAQVRGLTKAGVVVETTQITCLARLTVCGTARENTGMAVVEFVKDGLKEGRPAGEAEKSATTDALKRCARLFGIGRYLLDAPKEGAAFDKWLAGLQPKAQPQPPQPARQQPTNIVNIPLDANGEPDLEVLFDSSPANPPPEDRRIGTLTQRQAATLHDLGQKLGIAEPQKVLGVEKYSLYTGKYSEAEAAIRAAEAAIRAAVEAAKDASIQF